MSSNPVTRSPFTISGLLAGITVALAAIGPIISVQSAFVSPSQFAAALLAFHTLLVIFADRQLATTKLSAGFLLGAVLLGIGVASASDTSAAALAYVNFATGTVCGLAIAQHVIRTSRTRIDALDLGVVVFIAITAFQNFSGATADASAAELHATILVAWGGSNYVGAVLTIASFWLVARASQVRGGRVLLYGPAVVGILTAATTLSRGAVVAIVAGLLWLTWNIGKTRGGKFVWRLGAITVPLFGLWLMQRVIGERFANTSADPASNVNARIDLYRLAWDEFLSSPLFGTGWTGMRAGSELLFGSPISFAHNWYLSALQIAGVSGLLLLVVFTITLGRALLSKSTFSAPAAAILAAVMIEPVMEGYVGAMFATLVLVAVGTAEDMRRAVQSPASAPAQLQSNAQF